MDNIKLSRSGANGPESKTMHILLGLPDGTIEGEVAVYIRLQACWYILKTKLNGCIVWNAHNTVFDLKCSAICA